MNSSSFCARAVLGLLVPAAAILACGAEPTRDGTRPEQLATAAQLLAAAAGTVTGIAGTCLDADGNQTADGTKLQIWSCNGTGAQKWTRTAAGALVGPGGKCVDVAGAATANNTPVRLWTCNGTKAQEWSFSDGQLRSALGGCLNVKNGSSTTGTAVELYECVPGAASEAWTYNGAVEPPPPPGEGGGGTGTCAGASTAVDGIADAAHPSGKAPPTCTPSGYELAYVDDFPGTSLNSGWTLPSGFQYSGSQSWVSSSMVKVHDGMLDIGMTYSGRPGDESVVGWAQLTNNPVAQLTYGKLLVRQRADVYRNVAVATLTWPVAENTWPPEIDFAEDDIGDRHWYAFNHYKDSAGEHAQTVHDSDLTSDDWHTWGIEWSPSAIVYTRDGQVWKTETDPQVIPRIKMYLGFVMACFQTPAPGDAHWQMDWVALYRRL